MIALGHVLASVVAPMQWLLFAAVAGAVLAPRFIPPIARTVGRGIGRMSRRKRVAPSPNAIESGKPAAVSEVADDPRRLWALWLIVGLFAAVLSWFLLRSR